MRRLASPTAPLVLLLGCLIALGPACRRRPAALLHIAATTSVDNSGLLAVVLPEFQKDTGIEIDAVTVGSGRALDILDRRDAAATITHDPDAEARAQARGLVGAYRKIMFNDFVIAGPAADPAGIRSAASAAAAMARMADSMTMFVSRADSSGTHSRERQLWTAAGRAPAGAQLIETGLGMAATLRIASERQAYVLTDRATLAQLAPTLRLAILYAGDPILINPYAISVRAGLSGDELAYANRFLSWLTDGRGRDVIAGFTIAGQPAFTVWPPDAPRAAPGDQPHRTSPTAGLTSSPARDLAHAR